MKIHKKRGNQMYRKNKNILIEEYKSIYFFIPKNACTSIKTRLFDYLGDEDHNEVIHKYHFPFAHFDRLNTDYDDYLKFAFIRNPWNRLVSCFKNKIRSPEFQNRNFKDGVNHIFYKYGDLFYGGMPFKEFVDAVCSIPHSRADPHFISQLYWLTDFSGELLPNYIGRLENLDTAIEDIYQKTGLSLFDMKHENKSKIATPYTEYYDEALKEKVRAKFAGDIEIFGYEFESNAEIKPLGFVDDVFRKRLSESKFLVPILREKCKELKIIHEKKLQECLSSTHNPKTAEIFCFEKELAQKEKTIEALQNSLSWKITHPLRIAASVFRIKS